MRLCATGRSTTLSKSPDVMEVLTSVFNEQFKDRGFRAIALARSPISLIAAYHTPPAAKACLVLSRFCAAPLIA